MNRKILGITLIAIMVMSPAAFADTSDPQAVQSPTVTITTTDDDARNLAILQSNPTVAEDCMDDPVPQTVTTKATNFVDRKATMPATSEQGANVTNSFQGSGIQVSPAAMIDVVQTQMKYNGSVVESDTPNSDFSVNDAGEFHDSVTHSATAIKQEQAQLPTATVLGKKNR